MKMMTGILLIMICDEENKGIIDKWSKYNYINITIILLKIMQNAVFLITLHH